MLVPELGQNKGKRYQERNSGQQMKKGGYQERKQAINDYGGFTTGRFVHKDAKACLDAMMAHSLLRKNDGMGVKSLTMKMEL